MFRTLVTALALLSHTSLACSYVSAEFSVASISLGNFTFATNRCQGLAVKLPQPLRLTLDGSINFKIMGSDVYAYLYSDPYCEIPSLQPRQKIATNSKVQLDLFGQTSIPGLVFTIKTIHAVRQSVCAMSLAAARDCSWGKSDLYVNVSMPTGACVNPGGDFASGPGRNIFKGEVPGNVANSIHQQFSLKMDCCTDGSLRLANYTTSNCVGTPDHQDVIPTSYNGACLNVSAVPPGGGRRRRLFDFLNGWNVQQEERRRRLQRHGHGGGGGFHPPQTQQQPDSMIFELRWECSNVYRTDCSAITPLTPTQLPPRCSATCTRSSSNWWSQMVDWYKKNKHTTTATPGGYVVDPVHPNGDTASSGSGENKKSGLSGIDIAAIILSCVFFIVLVGALAYCCVTRNKSRDEVRNVRRSYAPMMEDELDAPVSNVVDGTV